MKQAPNFTYKPENVDSISEAAQENCTKEGFMLYFNDKQTMEVGINVVKSALNVKNYTVIEKPSAEAPKTAVNSKVSKENTVKAENKDSAKHSKQNLITVNLSKLDKLVDIVGELVIAESMVAANNEMKKLNLESFTKSTRQLRKLTDELQDIVMSLRMVPVSGIFQKMKRIVRDMGKELNKDVELILSG